MPRHGQGTDRVPEGEDSSIWCSEFRSTECPIHSILDIGASRAARRGDGNAKRPVPIVFVAPLVPTVFVAPLVPIVFRGVVFSQRTVFLLQAYICRRNIINITLEEFCYSGGRENPIT